MLCISCENQIIRKECDVEMMENMTSRDALIIANAFFKGMNGTKTTKLLETPSYWIGYNVPEGEVHIGGGGVKIDRKTGEITPKELAQISEETGEPLSDQDFTYILKTISGPTSSININQDEFYYIMTKKPEEALKITMATKSGANK